MAWSLDFISAGLLAQQGAYIRRAGWTDQWFAYAFGGWYLVKATGTHLVEFDEYTEADLLARDWTTEAFAADPCAATPAYNATAPLYRTWTSAPIFTPPPPPGFSDS